MSTVLIVQEKILEHLASQEMDGRRLRWLSGGCMRGRVKMQVSRRAPNGRPPLRIANLQDQASYDEVEAHSVD
ncbi:hypothetical protein BJX76DRAFT_324457 [Aspergillus varians]